MKELSLSPSAGRERGRTANRPKGEKEESEFSRAWELFTFKLGLNKMDIIRARRSRQISSSEHALTKMSLKRPGKLWSRTTINSKEIFISMTTS